MGWMFMWMPGYVIGGGGKSQMLGCNKKKLNKIKISPFAGA